MDRLRPAKPDAVRGDARGVALGYREDRHSESARVLTAGTIVG
jgi:hypothetical protein